MIGPVRASAALIVGVALCSSSARAETTKSFPVTATVVSGCTIATDASARWGTIDLGTTPGTAGATVQSTLVSAGGAGISFECTPGVTVAMTADAGDHGVGGQRYLQRAGGTATIPYILYANGSSSAWTTDPVSLSFVPGTGRRMVPVRAVATLSSATAAGTYTDTVRITLKW